MRPRFEYKTTDNRYVYNRLRKEMLEQEGKLRCSFCGYHKNENRSGKWYGGYTSWGYVGRKITGTKLYSNRVEYWDIRYPNWKLISKNRKQWMEKKVKKERYWRTIPSFEFVF